jgi:replicative DNA helicase
MSNLPHSIEAEVAVLGAILLDNAVLSSVADILSPEQFYRAAHRKIFGAALELSKRREPIDLLTLSEALRARGELAEVGGAAYLSDLADRAISPANIRHHARIVREKAIRRQAIDWASRIAEMSAEGGENLNQRLAHQAQALLATIEALKPTGSIAVRLSDVQHEHVEWLWRGRIPFGKPTILDGDPGLGKSTLSLEIAGRAVRGEPLPGDDDGCKPIGVVILSAEDGLSDTIRPRLEAAGATTEGLKRIVAIPTVPLPDGTDVLPEIPRDLPIIERAIHEVRARLVIVDPLMAYLGVGTSAHRDQDVRRALAPLARLAEETGAAILVIRHLNKRVDGNPLYRGGGSIGIIGAARSGLLVARDPDNEDRRVLAVTKANLAKTPGSLAFALEEAANGSPRVRWLGNSTHSAASLMAVPANEEERSMLDAAIEVLQNILAGGAVAAEDVRKQAHAAGVSDRTLDRAKARLGVSARKQGFGGAWLWELPTPPKSANDSEERQAEMAGTLREGGPADKQKPEETTEERQGSTKSAKAGTVRDWRSSAKEETAEWRR